MTHEMAAGQLGCPVGTIRSRLATARERLRRRLTHRGMAPAMFPAGLLGSTAFPIADSAAISISLPPALVVTTVRGALSVNMGRIAMAGIVSVEAMTLMEGVLKNMVTSKLILLMTTVLVGGLVTTGAGVAAYSRLGQGTGRADGTNPSLTASQKADARQAARSKRSPFKALRLQTK